jgi:hypothetical protein
MSRNRLWLRITRDIFFWIGVALASASFFAVAVGHTSLASRFDQARVPFVWVIGGSAILALFVAECCHSACAPPSEATKAPERTVSLEHTAASEESDREVMYL